MNRPRARRRAWQVRRCGDTGLLLELGGNAEVHRFAGALRATTIPGVVEIVPAMHTVMLVIDPSMTDVDTVARQAASVSPTEDSPEEAREFSIPVQYVGEDLGFVAEHTGLGIEGVIQAHTTSVWHVGFCGFAPGFAYLVGGDPRLQVPRHGESRVRVPAGAVALAGRFASIYPRESPGGWRLIGHTDTPLWDVECDPPALLAPGVRVRFHEASHR